MKKLARTLALVLVVASTLTGCDWFDDVTEVKKDLTFNLSFSVNAGADDATFAESYLLDAQASSSAIADYADMIEEINVKEIYYTVTAYTGSAASEPKNLTFSVANADGSAETTFATLAELDLATILNQEQELTTQASGVAKLEALIKNAPNQALVLAEGELNGAPALFSIKLRIVAELVADAL